MEQNDSYIIKINEIIQQDDQTKHMLRGLRNNIKFENIFKEYNVIARPQTLNPYDSNTKIYHFVITKNNEEIIKGSITPINKIQKFKVTFDYDFANDLVKLNDDIVQLFENAI